MTKTHEDYSLNPIGHIRSTLRALDEAPRQGSEGAPDAWLEVDPTFARALLGIAPGDEVVVVTWLHRVTVREISGTRLRIGPIEAIEGTPVVDVKPVLVDCADG